VGNERKTENIVRALLRKLGYFDDKDIIVEEQKSDFPPIDKLLKNASKKGGGKGRPEFIIRGTSRSNFLIIIECKADIKKHESKNRDKFNDYAVDGVLLYSSFLSKEYDVLAIAVSGENINEIMVSQFLCLRESHQHHKFFGREILSFEGYYNGFLKSDIKFNQDYEKLLEYTKALNEVLHEKKIKESQRSLLISGILISLQNKAFRNSYSSHEKAEQLANGLLTTISDEFVNANLSVEKVKKLKQSFSFVLTHTTLSNNKEFFEMLIKEIDKNINNFMRTHKYFDTLGQFYIEFLRYANNDKGLGIVLTPPHITEIFSDIAMVNKDSIIFDNCCGTGGFLIGAMKKMVEDADGDSKKISTIKNKQIIGIEYQDDIYALGVTNMIIHGDGKTNMLLGDCFDLSDGVGNNYCPTVGFLNPPYKSKKSDIEELDFVLNNVKILQAGGTCIAIVPLSCAISQSGDILERKKQILNNHTLEAVMSMPEDLFHNSKVNVVTCIFVITAHKPHPRNKKTWLGYWRDDGFIKTKSKGRVDLNNVWSDIRTQWLNGYLNREIIDGLSFTRELSAKDEWCAEAYLTTNYDQIDKAAFKYCIKNYLSYRLLNNLLNFSVKRNIDQISQQSKLVPLTDLFSVRNGLASSNVDVLERQNGAGYIRYVRPSQSYDGSIAGYVNKSLIDDKYIYPDYTIYVSTDGQGSHTYSYVSSFEFVPNSNVSVLIPKKTMSLNERIYYAMCITENRYKFSYGRKPKGERLKSILVPFSPPSFVYDDVFGEIFEDWKKIII